MRSAQWIRGLIAAIMFAVPAFADDGAPSMTAIAEALRNGRPRDAESLATQMMAVPNVNPLEKADLLLNRGLARERLGRREDALADFSAAIDAKVLPPPDAARALFDRGVTQDELGHTTKAIADYSAAIAVVPRYATALNNRGNAYRRTLQFEPARADYQAALDAGDDEPEYPLYGLGRIAEAQGDAVLAQSFYNKALAANAQYTPASRRLASLAASATPPAFALRPPVADTSADVNAPVPATTLPVTGIGEIDLHPPPSQDSSQRPRSAPPKHGAQGSSPFGLRPAILDAAPRKPGSHAATVAAVTPPVANNAAKPPNGAALIQLGAWRSKEDAADGWNHVVDRSGGLLSGMNPYIFTTDIPGKGRYWRLRAVPADGVDAAALCAQLKVKGLVCIVAKG